MAGKNPPGHRPCRPVSEVRQPDRPLPNHLSPPKRPKRPKRPGHMSKIRPRMRPANRSFPTGNKTLRPAPAEGSDLFYRKRQRETLRGAPSLMDDFLPSGSIKPTHRNLRPPSAEKKNKGKRLVAFPPCIGNFPSSDYSACRTAVIRSRSSVDDWAMYSAAGAF